MIHRMAVIMLVASACVMVFLLGGCAAGGSPRMLSEAEKMTPATLHVGDLAPPLAIAKWVQGKPVGAFEPGMVYVLDFWASWCGPCLASMPRASRLQDRHEGKVIVIGVTSLDSDNTMHSIREAVAE